MARPNTYKKAWAPLISENLYCKSHPAQLLELMSLGMLDCEIYAEMNIKKATFYLWRQEHDDFKEAFELGLSRCEAFYVKKIKECWINGDDKGIRYCELIMKNKFGWGKEENKGTTNHINIGNMNVIQQKNTQELIDIIQSGEDYLKLNNVLPCKVIDITPEHKDNE